MTQAQALSILKTGANVFLTGEPGAGKTHVINQYIAWLEAAKLNVAVTASTGIAATHIGGMTIHSWSGIGPRDQLTARDLDQITTREKVVKRIKKAHVLVIDEISMLDGKVVEMVNSVAKTVRSSEEPFGDLQVVFVGDFFQLPPVTRRGDMMRYAFESMAWQDTRPLICYIGEQYRHDDEMLSGLLASIRTGDIEEDHYTLLSEQIDIAYTDVEPTRLYTHNADVDAVNLEKLRSLPGRARRYTMKSKGGKPIIEGLVKNCLSPEVLELKEEALVMFTKNNFEAGYVNGTIGRVVEFSVEGFPVVETVGKKRITVEPASWEMMEDGKMRAQITQLPLRLAWAITVHKSQGMSLDAVEVDLSKAFVYGQGYVALSRVRTLAGLKVSGMHPNALQVDPKVIAEDGRFRADSEAAEETFSEMDEHDLIEMAKRFVTARGGSWQGATAAEASGHQPLPPEERVKKESTLEETKRLFKEGKSVRMVAKERQLTESTVWSHLETLCEQRELSIIDLSPLEPVEINWNEAQNVLFAAMDTHGTEKLKPIFEAAGETYDYMWVRLARMQYRLGQEK